MDSLHKFRPWLGPALAVVILAAGNTALMAQGEASQALANRRLIIAEVVVRLQGAPADQPARTRLESQIRRALGTYPGARVTEFGLQFGLQRVRRVPGVSSVDYDLQMLPSASETGDTMRLIVKANVAGPATPEAGGMIVAKKAGDFPTIYRDSKTLVKFDLTLGLQSTASGNNWFGNGRVLGSGPQLEKLPPPSAPILNGEGYLSSGVTVARELRGGDTPVYAYGVADFMQVGTVGSDILSSRTRYSTSLETVFGGVVGIGVTKGGNRWTYNVSYGRLPLCVGSGFFFCGIGGNGAGRGGLYIWPRTGGRKLASAQFGWNDYRLEAHYAEPNEVNQIFSASKLLVLNIERTPATPWSWGLTYVRALDSRFIYVLPNYDLRHRKGLNAFNPRVARVPAPGTSGWVLKLEGGYQNNSSFPMRAYTIAPEGGWSFGNRKWSPTVTFRYARFSGDDPKTNVYSMWDPLYGGMDFDRWLPSLLFRYFQYNYNLQSYRVMNSLMPRPGWRVVNIFTNFNAINHYNFPFAVSEWKDKHLGVAYETFVERSIGRQVYSRIMFGALWPGQGVRLAVPEKVEAPWYRVQASIRIKF